MQKLLQALTAPQPRTLYHFTDSRNVASIRQHGLLSLAALHDRGIAVAACGGDEDSRRVDARLGLDRFVHLSIMDQHPMEKIARDRGSIVAARYLRIDPAVLSIDGVMFCPEVSTTGEEVRPIADVDPYVDFEVAFSRTNWNDPAVMRRLQAMRKFEILVPDHVPVALLRGF